MASASVARFDRSVNHKRNPGNEQCNGQSKRQEKARPHGGHDAGDKKPDAPRNLKIQHILPHRIQSRDFIFFQKPDDQRSKNVAKTDKDDAREGAEMEERDPLPHRGFFVARRQRGRRRFIKVFHFWNFTELQS